MPNQASARLEEVKTGRTVQGVAIAVLVACLVLTTALTIAAELSYRHNEQRLLLLQTKLTGLVLSTAVGQVQTNLDRVAGLSAEAPDPSATFRAAIGPSLAPHGPYASANLGLVKDARLAILLHLGSPSFLNPGSAEVTGLFLQAAHTSGLVTNRAVKGDLQKIGFLVSARGPGGVYVVTVAEELRVGERVSLPSSSPDANLNVAVYFGAVTTRSALLETNVRRLPIEGTVAKVAVRFGTNALTLVTSSRGSLTGQWSEFMPWAVLVAGVLLSLAAASLTDRLAYRRTLAESLSALNRERYHRQRGVAEELQRSLLPETLPSVPGVDMAARYLPGTRDIEIGGDWYSVVRVDRDNFVFVVGDVSGHDTAAAGLMAALRYTTRALARLGMGPAEVLQQAEAELDQSGERFATVLVGRVDTARDELTLASAGHPPPLLVDGEQVGFVSVPPGPPLGVRGPSAEAITVPLRLGSVVLAFTDGLVERRGESIEDGLRRLAHASSASAANAEGFIDDILATLIDGYHEDDIAMLAVRFLGPSPDLLP
ncbi:MAG TPA: PP2C family protein-serine/threonine phosphatase [Acidimicrobiales bacterium]|nr:PP2C family protein-serine/threonine phosphatase [Acidimicrobiales bacterium]